MEDNEHVGFEVKHTIPQFLNNPSGAGSSFLGSRKLILDSLSQKYATLIAKHKDKFVFRAYQINGKIYFHVRVPSETYEDLTYDVVLEFSEFVGSSGNLNQARVKFFSNSPAYVFTYAHTFYQQESSVELLHSKFDREVYEQPPTTRNPEQVGGYEKVLVLAILYVTNNRLLEKSNYQSYLKLASPQTLLDAVASADDKLAEYKRKKQRDETARKTEKRAAKKGTINLDTVKDGEIKKRRRNSIYRRGTTVKLLGDHAERKAPVSNRVDSKVNNKVNSKVANKVDSKVKKK